MSGHRSEEGFVAGQDRFAREVLFGESARGPTHLPGAIAMFMEVANRSSQLCRVFRLDHEAAASALKAAAGFACERNRGDDRTTRSQIGEKF